MYLEHSNRTCESLKKSAVESNIINEPIVIKNVVESNILNESMMAENAVESNVLN